MIKKAVVYIHGKGGNAAEAAHYKPLFEGADVLGFDYHADTPWDAKNEFSAYFDAVCGKYDDVVIVANSIGAYFALSSAIDGKIGKAFFISPVVDMPTLISDMMKHSGVTEADLREKGEIVTPFGETLSWKYLCHVRENPINWSAPTHILYGERDHLTSFDTIRSFAEKCGATLDVMPDGEHWFHTEEQMAFLDQWIKKY